MIQIKDPDRRQALLKAFAALLVGAALALVIIMPLRGIMNAISRISFISQRLDDYPRMYAGYIQETDEWWNWWLKEDYGKRAEQAAFIYTYDDSHGSGEEKFRYIARTLGAEQAEIASEADFQTIREKKSAEGSGVSSAPLQDGRLLVLSFHNDQKEDRMAFVEDEEYFLSQLQAGLPGYVAVLHNGKLAVYPKDENEEAIRGMINGILESGKLDPEGLREKAAADITGTAQKSLRSPKTPSFPAGKYFLSAAAYRDNPDFVINIAEEDTLIRFGRKRSWSLWFLCCSIMILLVKCLWSTRLFKPGEISREPAGRRGITAMLLASLMILAAVTVIQMLSGVNLSQQGATDQAAYLKNVLGRETGRGKNIEVEFDNMFSKRAQTAAAVLSENPQLMDVDSLLDLDQTLGGAGLRVFSPDGTLMASDEILHYDVNESLAGAMAFDLAQEEKAEKETPSRYYRAVMTDMEGRTTGWVELRVSQEQLEGLLQDTRLKEVVGDLHILDTLHVVVAESGENGKIIASTWKSWVGDNAEEHGIHSQYLYDGYEGIVNFEGNKCYSAVFGYNGSLVIVGSEEASALVFTGGVLALSLLLILLILLVVYRPVTKVFSAYQEKELMKDPEKKAYSLRSEYPQLWVYFSNFMVSVFLLSTVLYFITKGDPAGLTYNIVRGTWVRGINAATITTCIMLVSVVFAAQRVMDSFLLCLGKYLSPKGMTICRLLDSCLTYISTIVMVIYALSMFGVNTKTLLNGVGVTALIFTLGANSLIADVLAGLFIIFEGDFTVGDVVVIDDFRGIVTDISMRTTKLMDDNTRDILVVNNSKISELVNKSRENSAVIIDISISSSVGLEKGEQILRQALELLPERFPEIIGMPEYWGISSLPQKNQYTGKLGGPKARIAFYCKEDDKEMLTYRVHRELVELVNELSGKTSTSGSQQQSGAGKQ